MFSSMFTRDRGFISIRTNIFEILKIYLGIFLETYLYHTCTEEYKPSITSKHTWKHTWKHTLKHTCKVTTCTFISVVILKIFVICLLLDVIIEYNRIQLCYYQFFFWHRAGRVILKLILPTHILKRATRWQERFFHEQEVRSCSRWRASNKRCAVSLGSAQCI